MSYFSGRGTTSASPASRSAASAVRSGSVTCVEPTNAAGSNTSSSVGATLKSPSTASGAVRREVGRDGRPQRCQPLQLVGVVVVAGLTAVGHVDRPQPHRPAGRPDRTGLDRREPGLVTQPTGDVGETDPGQQRHAVPSAVAVAGDPVSQGLDLGGRERVVGDLGLLQADRVRPGGLQPVQQPGQPGGDRVDVPGGDPHPTDAARDRLGQLRAAAEAAGAAGVDSWRAMVVRPRTAQPTKPTAKATNTPRFANAQAPSLPPRPNGSSR